MMRRGGALACSLLLLLGGGCGTVCSMADDQKVFGGTRFVGQNLSHDLSGGPCSDCGPLWVLDLPFSLAADIVVLPATAILALTRSSPPPKNDKQNP